MKKLTTLFSFILVSLWVILKWILNLLKRILEFIQGRPYLKIPFYALLVFILLIIVVIGTSGDKGFSRVLADTRINDASQMNPTRVAKVIKPQTVEEIKEAIRGSTGPISIGGGKFSMGGQTSFDNSLHIDMISFNKVLAIDTVKKQITVQPGIRWIDVQRAIDPYNLSVKIMQTYANFTVGGAISVNCHGRYIGHGPIISSVMEVKIITANGEMMTANRQQNYDVFRAIVGGYGGIGVIVEATLQLADNVKVVRKTETVKAEDYNTYFKQNIRDNKEIIFQNGDLYPPEYKEANSISWQITDKALTDTARINTHGEKHPLDAKVLQLVSWGRFGKWVRRNIVDPYTYRSAKVVWRNNEASYDVGELEPLSTDKWSYVLQEYFIPVGNINEFIPKMREVFNRNKVNVVNVSIRHALTDKETYLSWAPTEVFAFVIYYKQDVDAEAREKVKQWTVEMTDSILSVHGAWYLPYQPHATVAQFQKAYPDAPKYFAIKDSLDPNHRFMNKLLDKYDPYWTNTIEHDRNSIAGYYRAEEQTVLTVPEWYLVFNPKEYADYLESGKNPSAFPFYRSIGEYWKLYDRSLKLVSKGYPENKEYTTMLQIIGVSVTMEYTVKAIYENTVGRFFGLLAGKKISGKEQAIINAQRAYSNFIYDNAWYEFRFLPWVKTAWMAPGSGDSFLRKWERTLFFTFEFTFKAFYSQVLQWAAKASYEPPVTNIYLLVSSSDSLQNLPGVTVVKQQGEKKLLAIPRWGAFTKTMLSIGGKDIDIKEIGGNDKILISVLSLKSQAIGFASADLLYLSDIVTNPATNRKVVMLPVNQLLPFIRYCNANSIQVEHIFDY